MPLNRNTAVAAVMLGLLVAVVLAILLLFTYYLPRRNLAATEARMQAIGAVVKDVVAEYQRTSGEQPPYKIEPLLARVTERLKADQIDLRDGWGSGMKLTVKQTGGYRLQSPGPDARLFTNDDIIADVD